MEYATKLVTKLVADGNVAAQALDLTQLEAALEAQSWHVYVISFCARSDTALHWLHYGRSGVGAAIGFNAAEVQRTPYRLCPVLYDRDRQIEWCRTIVAALDQALVTALGQIPGDENRDLLTKLAGGVLASHVWMASPRMKNPAFAHEEEWRLVAYVPKGTGVPAVADPAGKTHFRALSGRIVPYKKLEFDVLPVNAIVLGHSSPMQFDVLALKVLMEEHLSNGDDVEVTVSQVAVRP
jgi:hypothetical protein